MGLVLAGLSLFGGLHLVCNRIVLLVLHIIFYSDSTNKMHEQASKNNMKGKLSGLTAGSRGGSAAGKAGVYSEELSFAGGAAHLAVGVGLDALKGRV